MSTMKIWMIIAAAVLAAVIFLTVRISYEIKHPVITKYVIKTPKLSKIRSNECQRPEATDNSLFFENTEGSGRSETSVLQRGKSDTPVRRKASESDDKPSGVTRFVFLSDLHGKKYGTGNEKLLDMIRDVRPDYILLGGDMIVSGKEQYDIVAYDLFTKVSRIAPAYLALGNHEQNLKLIAEDVGSYEQRFKGLIKAANDGGVIVMDNSKVNIGENFSVSGLSLDLKYYKKFKKEKLTGEAADDCFNIINRTADEGPAAGTDYAEAKDPVQKRSTAADRGHATEKSHAADRNPAADTGLPSNKDHEADKKASNGQIGKFDRNRYNIILAHNPEYLKEYSGDDRDLILSGHCHGGVMRIGGRGVISPDFKVFPKYSYGVFREKDTCMIVTSGIGSHSVNIRLFNRPEIVVTDIRAEDAQSGCGANDDAK